MSASRGAGQHLQSQHTRGDSRVERRDGEMVTRPIYSHRGMLHEGAEPSGNDPRMVGTMQGEDALGNVRTGECAGKG